MVLRYRTVFFYVNCFHLIVVYCCVEHPHFPPALRRIFHGINPTSQRSFDGFRSDVARLTEVSVLFIGSIKQ